VEGGKAVRIERSDAPDRETVEVLSERLFQFNCRSSGRFDFREFAVELRDDSGVLVGGATGWSRWEWLHLDVLWLDENCRGGGSGARLMTEVERIARERGCKLVDLDTFSFQAPNFYRKLGYEEYSVLEIGDGSIRKHFFRKRL